MAGALLVGLLSAGIMYRIAENPLLPPAVVSQIDLDSISFVSNDRLLGIMERTGAAPEQVVGRLRHAEARLQALKIGLLLVALFAALAIIPAGRLPGYKPGDIPDGITPRGTAAKGGKA